MLRELLGAANAKYANCFDPQDVCSVIRGSIEIATTELIQGWIHVEQSVVRDRVVLAFCGEECVGSSTINLFRDDLASAGMGDGYLGFAISVALDEDRVASVVVRLDGSDAVLLQSGARVTNVNRRDRKLTREAQLERMISLKWALKHARISQTDFDFQRMLWSLGVYERGLVRRVANEENLVYEDPHTVIAGLLESYAAREIETEKATVRDEIALKHLIAKHTDNPRSIPLIGVCAAEITWVRVLEGSHVANAHVPVDDRGNPDYAVYTLSAQNVIVFDARVVVDLRFPQDMPVDVCLVKAHASA